MSREIDEHVVSMEFDNARFEQRTKETLSTLDKLKRALKFEGAEKGFEQVESAAKKVDMNGLERSVDAVSRSFSALDVVAATALMNITNQAVNAGKRLLSSLSVDNITSGWEKYGQKTNAVGTLRAQGHAIEEINEQVQRLNFFTDETSYRFTDMIDSVGKFTAAGQGLTQSVDAMEGIALWAALSGQNASTASRAMYQLSQAMGKGTMRLDDWRSIQTANMDTREFRQNALDAAVALGTLQKNADGTYKSLMANSDAFTIDQFSDSLTKGAWFTSDVMMDVFKKYSSAVDDIYQYTEKYGVTAGEAIEALGDKVDQFGLKAFKAGQETRTYRDAIDYVKEAVSSQWSNIFTLIFGDYDEAVKLWSGLSETLYTIFVQPMEKLNSYLEEALGENPIASFVKEALDSTADVQEVTENLRDLSEVIQQVMRGDFGNGEARFNALEAAGYSINEQARIQNKVNELLGSSVRMEEELAKEADLTGTAVHRSLDELAKLDKFELNHLGYSWDFINSLYEAKEAADAAGVSIEDLANGETRLLSGREKMVNGLMRIGEVFSTVFGAIKAGFEEAFPSSDDNPFTRFINWFSNLTSKIDTSKIPVENITRIFRGFFNIFGAGIDLIKMGAKFIGSNLSGAFKTLNGSLGFTNVSVSGILADFFDLFTNFREWINDGHSLAEVFEAIGNYISIAKDAVITFLDNITGGRFSQIAESISSAFDDAFNFIAGLIKGDVKLEDIDFSSLQKKIEEVKTWFNGVPKNILLGLWNGFISNPVVSKVIGVISSIFNNVVSTAQTILGIHSPSTVFYWIGTMILAGLVAGLTDGLGTVSSAASSVLNAITRVFDKIDLNTLLTIGSLVGVFVLMRDMMKTIQSLGKSAEKILNPVSVLDTFFSGITGALKKVGDAAKIAALGKAMESFAKAMFILMAAITLVAVALNQKWVSPGYLIAVTIAVAGLMTGLVFLSKSVAAIDPKNTMSAVGIIAAIAGSILLIAIAMAVIAGIKEDGFERASTTMNQIAVFCVGVILAYSLMSNYLKQKGGILDQKNDAGTVLLKIAASMILIAEAMKILGKIKNLSDIQGTITVLFIGIGVMVGLFNTLKPESAKSLENFALKLGAAFVALAVALRVIDGIDNIWHDMAIIGALALGIVSIAYLFKVTKSLSGDVGDVSDTFLKMGGALVLMGIAMRIIGGMKRDELTQAAVVVGIFALVLGAFAALAKLGGKAEMESVGSMFTGLGIALIGIALAMRIIGGMSLEEISIAGSVIAALVAVLTLFLIMAKLGGEQNIKGVGLMLMALGVSLLLMAGAIAILGLLDPEKVVIGTAAISALVIFMGLFALLAKGMNGGIALAIGTMAVLIGVAVGAIAILVTIDKYGDVEHAATVLAGTIAVLAVAVLVLSGASKTISQALAPAFLIAVLVAAVVAGLVILNIYGPTADDALKYAGSLVLAMLGIIAVIGICAIAGTAAAAALPVIGYIAIGIAAIGAVAALIGDFDKKFGTNTADSIKRGMDALAEIGNGIGRFFGSIIGGFGEGVAESLPEISENIKIFIETIKEAAGDTSLDSIPKVVKAVVSLNSLSSFNVDAENLKTQFTSFGDGIAAFFNSLKNANVDTQKVESAAAAGIMIASVIDALPKTGGLLQGLIGEGGDIGSFGTAMDTLGNGIASFVETTKDVAADDADNAVAAAKAIAGIYDELPKIGGIAQKLVGENMDLTQFGTDMENLGGGIAAFCEAISTEGFSADSVTAAATAAKVVAELYPMMPHITEISGAFFAVSSTSMSLSDFAEQMDGLGISIHNFAVRVKGINEDSVNGAVAAAKLIVGFAQELPDDPDTIFEALGNWAKSKLGVETNPMDGFVKVVDALAPAIQHFNEAMNDVDSAQLAANTGKLRDMLVTLNQINNLGTVTSGQGLQNIATLAEALATLEGTDVGLIMSQLLESFDAYQEKFYSTGDEVVNQLLKGMQDKKSFALDIMAAIVEAMISKAQSYSGGSSGSMYSVGVAFGSALANGIASQEGAVYSAAQQIAAAAIRGAQSAGSIVLSFNGSTPVTSSESSGISIGSVGDTLSEYAGGILANGGFSFNGGSGSGSSTTTDSHDTNITIGGVTIPTDGINSDVLNTAVDYLKQNIGSGG